MEATAVVPAVVDDEEKVTLALTLRSDTERSIVLSESGSRSASKSRSRHTCSQERGVASQAAFACIGRTRDRDRTLSKHQQDSLQSAMPRLLLPALILLVIEVACSGVQADCSNGTCVCEANAQCNLTCDAPPCHVDCGSGSSCSGVCANGDCTCEEGASCSFTCGSPPCHVTCEGDNPQCDGTCADGQCTCGADSTCRFTCASGPCHTTCPAGAHCVVDCPAGTAGTENCDITSCAAGKAVLCAGGKATTCGAECPKGS
jgi:hypothetical protein